MKYFIYCLINPIDGKPFYVGATRNDLKVRLSEHISCRLYHGGFLKQRMKLIRKIIKKGMKPEIKLLKTVVKNVDYHEAFFYRKLKRQGFELLQRHDRFFYSKQEKHWK
jgi:hypothetical protein